MALACKEITIITKINIEQMKAIRQILVQVYYGDFSYSFSDYLVDLDALVILEPVSLLIC